MPIFRSGKPKWRLYRTTNYAAPTGSFNVPWEAAEFQDPVVWTGGTDVVVDRPGLYIVGGSVRRSAVATGSSSTIRVRVNGVTKGEAQMISTTASTTLSVATLVELEALDILTLAPAIGSVGSPVLEALNTTFWGTRVGPVRWTG